MKRFVWKVVSLMMLVSILPLLSSGLIINSLFSRALTEGFREEVGASLDDAAVIYRSNIGLRRKVMMMQTRQLAADEELRTLLAADPPDGDAIGRVLDARARAMTFRDQAVSAVALSPAGDAPGEAAAQEVVAEVDRRHAYPGDAWRQKDVPHTLIDKRGRRWMVRVTYVAPWSLFDRFEKLGKVKKFYDTTAAQQTELTVAYTKTFFAVSGGVLLLTLVIALLLARATTRPLRALAEATARVGRGDLEVEVPVRGSDELAQLTVAFNRMVADLRQARVRVSYLERVSAWQEIARRLAHEIKNPLTPILLAVQQLDRKFDDYLERPQRYRKLLTDALEIVTEEVDALRTLVVEFSDFARLPEVDPQPTEVGPFVEGLLALNPQFDRALAPFEDRSAGAVAGVDTTMMRRVVINLVDNAIEAVEAVGGDLEGSVSVTVEREEEEQLVVIAVEDRGGGIDAEHLDQIFDPYFTTKANGTGLGLAIVRKIVIEHGGDIAARSRPEGGARMEVRLPAGR